MRWVSRIEKSIESLFARVFSPNTTEPGDGQSSSKENQAASFGEEGAVQENCVEQSGEVNGLSGLDDFGKQQADDIMAEEDAQKTNRFTLFSERKHVQKADEAQTITWKRPTEYILEVVEGSEIGAVYHGGDLGTCLIGRGEECDFIIPDVTVSKRHAKISIDGGGWVVEDLGSTNGTFVNGKRVAKASLKHDDTLRIGLTTIKFRLLDNQ